MSQPNPDSAVFDLAIPRAFEQFDSEGLLAAPHRHTLRRILEQLAARARTGDTLLPTA